MEIENNNSQPSRNGQPVQTAPVSGQRQFPVAANPGHNDATPPAEHSPSPGNRYAPVTPVQSSAPNYNSTDNRRYVPSPHMQQTEPQNPGVNSGNSGRTVWCAGDTANARQPAGSKPFFADAAAATAATAQLQRAGNTVIAAGAATTNDATAAAQLCLAPESNAAK